VVLAGQTSAVADRATFHDAANDVVNVHTGNVATTAAGLDVRAIRVSLSEQATRVRIHHKNLRRPTHPDSRDDRILLDTRRGDRGPEWVMVLSEFDYDLYRVDTHFQAEHPRPGMHRSCGDAVSIDYVADTTLMRLPDRCLPRANRVRTTGTFGWKPQGRAPRVDHWLGYRMWTPWVRR
jgi:hypothetical protein